MARCEALGLRFAPIAQPADPFDDPHLRAPGGLVDLTLPDGRAGRLPALPLAMDGERLAQRLDLSHAGEHTEAILAELGWADETSRTEELSVGQR